jgi:nucleoside-diphosphate-sugar epimerase
MLLSSTLKDPFFSCREPVTKQTTGDLKSLDVLRQEAQQADAVIHLATAYEFGQPDYDVYLPIDSAAADALAEGLEGTNKPLIATSGTLLYAADPSGKETNEDSPLVADPILTRGKFDDYVLSLVKTKGINVKLVRLAPFVYGRGGSGVARFMGLSFL